MTDRRDGLEEIETTWGDLRIGDLIAGDLKRDVYEVTDMKHPDQIEDFMSMWVKIAHITTGEEFSIPPRALSRRVTVLLRPGTERPASHPAPDAGAIALLVEKLGAVEIGTQDNESGEVHCPTFMAGFGAEAHASDELHLRLAHNIDLEGVARDAKTLVELHGQAHSDKHPLVGKGGFPHRHVPPPETHTKLEGYNISRRNHAQ